MFVPATGERVWTVLNPNLSAPMKFAFVADFSGGELADIALPFGALGNSISVGGRAPLTPAPGLASLPQAAAVGRFDGAAAGAEVLTWNGANLFKSSLTIPTPVRQSRQGLR
jgi:hypothetical protein